MVLSCSETHAFQRLTLPAVGIGQSFLVVQYRLRCPFALPAQILCECHIFHHFLLSTSIIFFQLK